MLYLASSRRPRGGEYLLKPYALSRRVRFDEDAGPVNHGVASTSSREQLSHRMPGAEDTSLVVPEVASGSPSQRRCHRIVGVEGKTLAWMLARQ